MVHYNANIHQQRWRKSHPGHLIKQYGYQRDYIKRWAEWRKISRTFLKILL